MTKFGNLWAIGYDDMARADEVRKEITGVGSKHFLIVADLAVVVRHHDGSFTDAASCARPSRREPDRATGPDRPAARPRATASPKPGQWSRRPKSPGRRQARSARTTS